MKHYVTPADFHLGTRALCRLNELSAENITTHSIDTNSNFRLTTDRVRWSDIVALFPSDAVFPGTFLRLVKPADATERGIRVPLWAVPAGMHVAMRSYGPDEYLEANLRSAIIQLHMTVSGWRPPHRSRGKRERSRISRCERDWSSL